MEKTSFRRVLLGTCLAVSSVVLVISANAGEEAKAPPQTEQKKAIDATQTGECQEQPAATQTQPEGTKDAATPDDKQLATMGNRNMQGNMGMGGDMGNMGGNMGGGAGTGTGMGGMGMGGMGMGTGPCATGTTSSSSSGGGSTSSSSSSSTGGSGSTSSSSGGNMGGM